MALSRMIAVVATLLPSTPALSAEPWQAPDSPFMLGEAYPEKSATCETVKYWIDKAPQIDARVTFAITGELVAAESDDALAYLIMCEDSDVQVMCVTYSKHGRNVGDTVLFGGGYSRIGERRVLLDPCLASTEE